MDNLFTTFAFLVDAFSRTAPKFGQGENKPNVSAIAEHIEGLVHNASGPDKLYGQSAEAIKSRIEDAMRIKKGKLRGK